jgi:hypothetical protein
LKEKTSIEKKGMAYKIHSLFIFLFVATVVLLSSFFLQVQMDVEDILSTFTGSSKNEEVSNEQQTQHLKRQRVEVLECHRCNTFVSRYSATNCYVCGSYRMCEECVDRSTSAQTVCSLTSKVLSDCACGKCASEVCVICDDCSEGGFTTFDGGYLREKQEYAAEFERFLMDAVAKAYHVQITKYNDVRLIFFGTYAHEQTSRDSNYYPRRVTIRENDGVVISEVFNPVSGEVVISHPVVNIPKKELSTIDENVSAQVAEEEDEEEEHEENDDDDDNNKDDENEEVVRVYSEDEDDEDEAFDVCKANDASSSCTTF